MSVTFVILSVKLCLCPILKIHTKGYHKLVLNSQAHLGMRYPKNSAQILLTHILTQINRYS